MTRAPIQIHHEWADSVAEWAAHHGDARARYEAENDPMAGCIAPPVDALPEDYSQGDDEREAMSPRLGLALMCAYVASAGFVAWLLYTLAAAL